MLDFSASKIFTIPNFLSFSRIIAVPFIGWLLMIDNVPARLGAAALLFYAILSDFLDGWLARLLDQRSDLGRMIDPLADKLFVIMLAIELIALRGFPLWLALVIVIKDVLIVGGSVFVASRKRVVMESNLIGKYAFAFQAGLVVCYFLDFPFGELFFGGGSLLLIAASLISYGKAFHFVLTSPEEEVVVKPKPPLMPAWLRRAVVIALSLLVLAHGYYWCIENSRIDTEAVAPAALQSDRAFELAEKYSPVFVFADGDEVRPLAVESYLGSAELRSGLRFFWGAVDTRVEAAPIEAVDLRTAASTDAYLALPDDTGFPLGQEMVYARAVALSNGEDGWICIQYWMLFPSEDGLMPLDGDWEMAAVYLGPDGTPRYLATTQGWYGSGIEWSKAELRNDHPMVYVAPGNHSLYTSSGTHTLYVDEERIIPAGSVAIEEGEEIGAPGGYALRLIGDGDQDWVDWPGRWGGPLPGGDRGPRYWNPKQPSRAPWSRPMAFLRFFVR